MEKRTKVGGDFVKKEKSEYTRVTAVLDSIDAKWYQYWMKSLAKSGCPNPVQEAERVSEESAEFGRQVHKIVEAYLKSEKIEPLEFHPRANDCAAHIIQWIKEVGAEVVQINGVPAVEFEVKDEELKLIGHFDALLKVGSTYWLTDWKSSSKMRKTFPLQKAAYAKMLNKQYGFEVNDGVTVRVDRDPSAEKQFEIKEYHQLREKYWPVFLKALDVYSYLNGKGIWSKKGK